MPLLEGYLAVVRKSGYYKDLDSGEKDYLSRGDVVRLSYKQGSSWVVDAGPGSNAMSVPVSSLVGFKDPEHAEKHLKPGNVRRMSNPRKWLPLTWYSILYPSRQEAEKDRDWYKRVYLLYDFRVVKLRDGRYKVLAAKKNPLLETMASYTAAGVGLGIGEIVTKRVLGGK